MVPRQRMGRIGQGRPGRREHPSLLLAHCTLGGEGPKNLSGPPSPPSMLESHLSLSK